MPHWRHKTCKVSDRPEGMVLTLAWREAWVTMGAGLAIGLLLAIWVQSVMPHAVADRGALPIPLTGEAVVRFAHRLVRFSLPGAEPAIVRSPTVVASFMPEREQAMPDNAAQSSPDGNIILSSGWSVPENLSLSTNRSANPALVAPAKGIVHVVWEEGNRVYHSLKQGSRWSNPQFVATGERPAAAVSPDGRIHVVYSNEFGGMYNVFYVAWSGESWTLPRLVSKTSGLSALASITVDSDGVVHAVWHDMTPGYPIIYHGWLEETWLNEPLYNARGTAPVIANDARNRVVHVAWQARGPNNSPHDVFHVQGRTYQWSLPENISVAPQDESLNVAMACDEQGLTHLVWQEHSGASVTIRYVGGRIGNWIVPETVSSLGKEAYEPVAVVAQGSQLQVVWREGNSIVYRRRSGCSALWRSTQPIIANERHLEGVALAAEPDGDLHVAWAGWSSTGESDVFHSKGERSLQPQVFIPTLR